MDLFVQSGSFWRAINLFHKCIDLWFYESLKTASVIVIIPINIFWSYRNVNMDFLIEPLVAWYKLKENLLIVCFLPPIYILRAIQMSRFTPFFRLNLPNITNMIFSTLKSIPQLLFKYKMSIFWWWWFTLHEGN